MAQRKLQQEIDKVIKKVKEGTLEFDYLYDKLISTENPSQKEKLEGDLKKEIKKLQRSRDQIKTWMSGNEVKDKTQLAEMRREIEADMEKFKDIEKEMKTKLFSRQGLNMQQKLDPREKEKLEMANFLQSMIEELEIQSESHELRVDLLSNSKRKLTSKKLEELKDTQEKLDRNNYHQTQFETLLRLLENGDLETEDIQEMREDIEYYVGHNQEDLFVDDDNMYELLGLESKEEYFAALQLKEDARNVSPSPAAVPPTEVGSPSPPPGGARRVVSGAGQGLVAGTPSGTPLGTPSGPVSGTISGSLISKPPLPSSGSTTSVNNSSSVTTTPAKTTPTPKIKYASLIAATQEKQAAAQLPLPLSQMPNLTRITTNTTVGSSITRESTQSPQLNGFSRKTAANGAILSELQRCESALDLLPLLDELGKRLESPQRFDDIAEMLKSSLLTCPDSFDADKRKIYHSDLPTRTFVYYPQEPLILLTNNSKNLGLYDDSTLFYIFYHHKARDVDIPYHTTYGKYLHYAAGKELGERGWKYSAGEQQWYKPDEASWDVFDYRESWTSKRSDSVDVLSLK